MAECLPSMFKTLYLIPKHCKKTPKTIQGHRTGYFLHHCDKRYDRKHLREEVRIWADIFSLLWCARHWEVWEFVTEGSDILADQEWN